MDKSPMHRLTLRETTVKKGHEQAGGLILNLGQAGNNRSYSCEFEGLDQTERTLNVVEDTIAGVAGGEDN